jgi:hypothetical protein
MLQNGSVPKPRWVVIYGRVSSKEQEVEGFSIPARLELLRDYASKQGMRAVQEFVDVESASTSGRTGFRPDACFFEQEPQQVPNDPGGENGPALQERAGLCHRR